MIFSKCITSSSSTRFATLRNADSDEVARAFRDDLTRGSGMMSPWC
jgi:hypothetical protein